MKAKHPKKLSKVILSNILSVYHKATSEEIEEGMYWYTKAYHLGLGMAQRHGFMQYQCAGVIASLSPGMEWGRNIINANLLIEEYSSGKRGEDLPMLAVYNRDAVRKAEKFLEPLSLPMDLLNRDTGPKTWAFYSLIACPESEEVCIDRHAKCLALNITKGRDKNSLVKPGEYGYIAQHYRAVAEELGLIPNQLQAITWVTWKRLVKG